MSLNNTKATEVHLGKIRRDPLKGLGDDPAVNSHVGPFGMQQVRGVEKAAAATPYQRRKKEQDQKRSRQAYDLSPAVVEAISKILGYYRDHTDQRLPFSISDLVESFIILGIENYLKMQKDPILPRMEQSNSPRFAYHLREVPVPTLPETTPWENDGLDS